MQKFRQRDPVKLSEDQIKKQIEQIVSIHKIPYEVADKAIRDEISKNKEVYINDKYQVIVREDIQSTDENWTQMIWISVKRLDQKPIHDWRDLQEIKNIFAGEENEGVEIYPAESRLVDQANQFHIWCFKDKNRRFPFGFNEGRVIANVDEAEEIEAKQRPLPGTELIDKDLLEQLFIQYDNENRVVSAKGFYEFLLNQIKK